MSSIISTSCSEPREQYSNTIAVRVGSLSQPGEEEEEENKKEDKVLVICQAMEVNV